jgi:hypothetical protein
MFINKIYYSVRPLIPRRIQILLRRQVTLWKKAFLKDLWPIDKEANRPLGPWAGWPEKKQFAFILTHDVDTAKGQDKCEDLIKLEEDLGFRSSFYFVPERYNVSSKIQQYLAKNGFEVGVHGLNHDGKLYQSYKLYMKRAARINGYLRKWDAVGFRSPSSQRNLNWIKYLNIKYDSSSFDIDPFEAQPDGFKTIFPFWVNGNADQKGYVELPYTLPQDFTLFVLMKQKTIDIWKQKLDWIAERGGMALLITHPDYMNFSGKKLGIEEYPAEFYKELLEYVKSKYSGLYWTALPKDVAEYFKNANHIFDKHEKI